LFFNTDRKDFRKFVFVACLPGGKYQTAMTSKAQEQEIWNHREATVNGVRLHYVEAGAGPLVVLLHGFPEFWYSWRYQIPVLAAAGFHVIASDMRGYNVSDKPAGVQNYRYEMLTDDVVGLIHHLGAQRATLVGHDWGGAIAFTVPMRYPEVVEKLVVLNGPPPGALFREIKTLTQLRRSWYMFFFQLPWLPEAFLRTRGYALLERILRRDPVHTGAFTEADIERYKEALAQPGVLTASINYYRALFRRNPLRTWRAIRRIDVPTLLIWGEQDRYLGLRFTEGLERWVPNIRIERLPEASHWVQSDAPERVNQLLIGFLRIPPRLIQIPCT
jgi:epoxide hydrolase 4